MSRNYLRVKDYASGQKRKIPEKEEVEKNANVKSAKILEGLLKKGDQELKGDKLLEKKDSLKKAACQFIHSFWSKRGKKKKRNR